MAIYLTTHKKELLNVSALDLRSIALTPRVKSNLRAKTEHYTKRYTLLFERPLFVLISVIRFFLYQKHFVFVLA